jgi:mannitol/fructose-specific phosphotransferase system IIA component (Ntr-type)
MVFVIAGTKDERTFHLRALSTIAQIVENPNFREKWMKAEDPEALRDLILLGKRER